MKEAILIVAALVVASLIYVSGYRECVRVVGIDP